MKLPVIKHLTNFIEKNDEDHGPESFYIAFINDDAITCFEKLVDTVGVPRAVVYIRPGISFGGNRATFPQELSDLIVKHKKYIDYIAHDWGMTDENPGDMPEVRKIFDSVKRNVTCHTCCEDKLQVTVLGKSYSST